MYLFVFLLPFIMWVGLAFFCKAMVKKNGHFLDARNYDIGMFFGILFGSIMLIVIFITNLVAFSEQRSLFNLLQNQTENRTIYENKMVNMTAQYKEVLVKDYPQYEKAIFEKMSPEDATKLTQLLSVYPQLKSSVTMGAYADNIKELNDAIYKTDLDIRETVKSIRWNYMTPWCMTSLMPNVPTHIAKYVNR